MVLVGTGGVDHSELVKLAEKHFASLPVSANPIPLGRLAHPKTEFVGSEVRVRDDTMSTAHIAIAVEGVGWSSPDYFPMLVMQSIIGNWDRSLGAASLTSSSLSRSSRMAILVGRVSEVDLILGFLLICVGPEPDVEVDEVEMELEVKCEGAGESEVECVCECDGVGEGEGE